MDAIKRRIVGNYTRLSGRHDEADLYARPDGDPGLIGPGSVSWELHSDMAAMAVGGTAAIIMEILHPAVMAGVHDHSDYQSDPFRRARNTTGYVLSTTFGGTAAAERTIRRVRAMHERVSGTAPDGTPYRAMNPELIAWVHTCIPWGVMRAFERYNRPLTPVERDRYLAEQSVIGIKSGADRVPVTAEELEDYIETVRPRLELNDQTRGFLDFLRSAPMLPRYLRPLQTYNLHAAMAVMPEWAQRLTGLHHHRVLDRLVIDPHARLNARLLHWAFETPPFRAMAEARVSLERESRAVG